jgi:hypothetical protein
MAENRCSDAEFAARVLALLPESGVPAGLEARILADFNAVTAKRQRAPSWRAVFAAVWPGMPLWQPGAVLAVSLLCGLLVGSVVPVANTGSDTALVQQVSEAAPALTMLGDL